ncbi:hypothetical protein [Nocardioides litoris]|uniref:hypothetical protein n=1 Tax=Nocardioides litoris TaxID=1926648 RepID=UPI00112016B5|nr:hypothetical protein [Nocardioides litoris]
MAPSQDALDETTRARLELAAEPDEIAHVVCCREDPWERALCGEPIDAVNLAAETVCTLCVEVAMGLPGWAPDADPPRCVLDGTPCPDEHDIDLRILREVTRPPG